jgi:hypothetical protein
MQNFSEMGALRHVVGVGILGGWNSAGGDALANYASIKSETIPSKHGLVAKVALRMVRTYFGL